MFIKLTSAFSATPVYVKLDAITGIQQSNEMRHGSVLAYTLISTGKDQYAVKETPDQVMALINPAS